MREWLPCADESMAYIRGCVFPLVLKNIVLKQNHKMHTNRVDGIRSGCCAAEHDERNKHTLEQFVRTNATLIYNLQNECLE